MTQKSVYSIFQCSLFENSQKILLSGWLHRKLISTLKFSCFELSHRRKIAQRHWNLLKLIAIILASPLKKAYLVVHLTTSG